jgi:hypothetical protein
VLRARFAVQGVQAPCAALLWNPCGQTPVSEGLACFALGAAPQQSLQVGRHDASHVFGQGLQHTWSSQAWAMLWSASAPKKARLHMCCMPDTRRMRELMRKPTELLTYTKTNEISRGGLVAPNTGNHMEGTKPPLEISSFFLHRPPISWVFGFFASRSPVSQNNFILGRPGVPENMILGSPVIHKR